MPLHGLGHEFGKQAAALVQILSCLATSSIEGTSRFRSPTNYFDKAFRSEFRFDPVLRSKDCRRPSQVRLYRRLERQYGESFCRSRPKTRTFRSVHYRGRKAPEGQFAVYAERDGGFPPFLEELGENRDEPRPIFGRFSGAFNIPTTSTTATGSKPCRTSPSIACLNFETRGNPTYRVSCKRPGRAKALGERFGSIETNSTTG